MTIAQQLKIKTFPFSVQDEKGNVIYYEHSNGSWVKWEYDDNGKAIYIEHSNGDIIDNRPPKVVEIEGIKYKLVKL